MGLDFYTEKKLDVYFNYEPKLKDVFLYVMKPERKNEDWEHIYSYVKTNYKIEGLVGFHAAAIELRNSESYEFIIKTLVDVIWGNSKECFYTIDESNIKS